MALRLVLPFINELETIYFTVISDLEWGRELSKYQSPQHIDKVSIFGAVSL